LYFAAAAVVVVAAAKSTKSAREKVYSERGEMRMNMSE
jgi:hypothetical protein